MLPERLVGRYTICTTRAIGCNPLFNLSSFDFTFTVSSPAVDAGLTENTLTWDHKGVTRPQGSAYDIGLLKYFAGGSTVVKPNPPTNLSVVVQ